jgi:V/A-type H+-transporting ATPase subunit I
MIERMTKLTLLFHHSDTECLLAELQRLGALHVEGYGVRRTGEIDALEARIERLERTRDYLASLEADPAPARALGGSTDLDEGQLTERVEGLRESLSQAQAERRRLAAEMAAGAPWGGYDPSRVEQLRQAGYGVKLFAAARASMRKIAESCAGSSSSALEEIREERGTVWFAVVYPVADGPPPVDAAGEDPPARGRKELVKLDAQAALAVAEAGQRLREQRRFIGALEERIRACRNELARDLAAASLEPVAESQLRVVKGWVPQRSMAAVTGFLEQQEVFVIREDPAPGEKVPILLRNRPFARLFEPVMRIFSLPSYSELDTTPFLAPFYVIFFGLCVADLVYGLILLAAMLAALFIMRNRVPRSLVLLGIVLSSSVALMGLLLGEAGGVRVTSIFGAGSALRKAVLFPSMFAAMYLAIALGVVQVIFGHVLRVANEMKKHGPMGALGPTGVVLLLLGALVLAVRMLGPGFAIGPLEVGALGVLPRPVGFGLLGAGLVLVLLFNNLNARIYVRPGLGMWELYELATGTIGDVLSYLRLFALGLADGLLAEAMVRIAGMVRGDSWWGYIPAALILLAGSGINLAIGLISAFVHSLRLTFVEFYKAVGFTGGGIEYAPFKGV